MPPAAHFLQQANGPGSFPSWHILKIEGQPLSTGADLRLWKIFGGFAFRLSAAFTVKSIYFWPIKVDSDDHRSRCERERGNRKLIQDMVLLNSKYTLKTAKDVYDFVGSNPHLLTLLMEAYSRIRFYFPREILLLDGVRIEFEEPLLKPGKRRQRAF